MRYPKFRSKVKQSTDGFEKVLQKLKPAEIMAHDIYPNQFITVPKDLYDAVKKESEDGEK